MNKGAQNRLHLFLGELLAGDPGFQLRYIAGLLGGWDLDRLGREIPSETQIFELGWERPSLGLLPWPSKLGSEVVYVWEGVMEYDRIWGHRDRKPEENKIVDPILWRTEVLRR
jgi:hypothetical protein